MKTFGERLKEIRELKGYPQKHVADYLHMQRSNYSKIENDHQNMSHKQLRLFCELHDVSADYILGLNPTNKKIFMMEDMQDIDNYLNKIKDLMKK
ncbi:MAG: helix-turn-helix domain-containing protein [Firmicutes bacterium]|nr:helix-turn-helix domain-containing protein [Bacillota bacterium]